MENDDTKEKVFQETLEMEVGRRLKEFRKALPGKFTQKKMCEELGMTQGLYSMYESGLRSISNPIKKALEQRFNLNIVWLDTGVGPMFTEDMSNVFNLLFPKLNQENQAFALEFLKKIYVAQCHEGELKNL